jgi:hypothetical protein
LQPGALFEFVHRKCLDSKLLTGFSIAGDDGRFVPAQAANEGDKVLVSSLLIERCQVCMERNGADEPCQSGGTPIGAIQNSMNYSFGRPLTDKSDCYHGP